MNFWKHGLVRGAIYWGLPIGLGWALVLSTVIWALGSYEFIQILWVLGKFSLMLFPAGGVLIELVMFALNEPVSSSVSSIDCKHPSL